MGRKNKPRVIPEQDKRICGFICFCQLVVVLSCVSIVYLSVAIYAPSLKAFKSGFELDPVMCQTIDLNLTNNCRWASCGEWCLTKTSGFCPQIHSTVRRNGTDIQLNNCTKINNVHCPQVEQNNLTKYNCNNGSLCSVLRGVFNCSMGHCKNMSEAFQCRYKVEGPSLDPEQDNTKLNGFFECYGPKCSKIRLFSCDRICNNISTHDKNVFIMQEDSVFSANCKNGLAFNQAHGNGPGEKIEPTEFWKETDEWVILTNCATVIKEGDKLRAYDCLNGTLLNETDIPDPVMNFTQFWKIYEFSDRVVDSLQRFLPKQSNLTIYNSTQLFINLEGCVNTLRGECKEFTDSYGKDGDNNTAQSRYLCYYNKEHSNFVIARHDLDKTYRELLISLITPTTLFVISSITLCILTKSVKVGDDAKMRCQYCTDENSDLDESYMINNKPQRKYHVEIHEPPTQLAEVHAEDIVTQQTDIEILESHEMVGSTKSLIPISPTDDESSKEFLSENEPNKNSEDPLMVT